MRRPLATGFWCATFSYLMKTIPRKIFDHYSEWTCRKQIFSQQNPSLSFWSLFVPLYLSHWKVECLTNGGQGHPKWVYVAFLIFSASIFVDEGHFFKIGKNETLPSAEKRQHIWALFCSAWFASMWNIPRTSFLLQWRLSCTWMPSKTPFKTSKIG